jgi:hypothetical protein
MLGEQHVFVGTAKLINAGAFAVFRDWGCPARFLNRNGIGRDRIVGAPGTG